MLRGVGVPEEQLLLVEAAMAPEAAYDNDALLARLAQVIDTDPLCIIHTSGSTGIPKGVALNHRCTIDFMDWAFQRLGLDGTEAHSNPTPRCCCPKRSAWPPASLCYQPGPQ